jgi:hypothetical protein
LGKTFGDFIELTLSTLSNDEKQRSPVPGLRSLSRDDLRLPVELQAVGGKQAINVATTRPDEAPKRGLPRLTAPFRPGLAGRPQAEGVFVGRVLAG